MTQEFRSQPIRYEKGIPIFSQVNDYITNYIKISNDHLDNEAQTGENPFINKEIWMEYDVSTISLIKKYCRDGQKILDVGVGMGNLLSNFPKFERYGMDISLEYLDRAKEKGINVCFSLIEDMPYKDNFFDAVCCTDVLEHLVDEYYCIRKILNVLKPGGILIVRVPYNEDLVWYSSDQCKYEYCHLRRYDEPSLIIPFKKIYKMEWLETKFCGYDWITQKCKIKIPIQGSNKIIYLAGKLANFIPPLREGVVKKLFEPLEVNVVFKKQFNNEMLLGENTS